MSAQAWRPPASPLMIDALIAAAATVLVQTAIWAGVGVITDGRAGAIAGRPLLLALLFAPATVALLWRRRCPLAAVGLWAAAVGVQALSTHNTPEGTAILLPTFAAVYSLGAHATRRQALVALPALVAGLALHGANDRAIGEKAFAAAFYWLAIAAFYAIGMLVQP